MHSVHGRCRLAPDPDLDIDPALQTSLVEAYRRASIAVAARHWAAAIDQFRTLARDHAGMPDLWASLASVAERAERHEIAADAYRRILSADPGAADARLGLSWVLLRARRLDEARSQAELVADNASGEPAVRAGAHEVLARIALATHDPGGARVQAQHVLEVDPTSPFASFIEGRLLFERARYDEALPLLEAAAAQPEQVLDLHVLRGETLARLDRAAEAEDAYLSEVRLFPENTRAYLALASLYHAQQRDDEVSAMLTRLTDTIGTPDAFESSAKLWASFGNRDRALAVRAEAQRTFTAPSTSPTAHQ